MTSFENETGKSVLLKRNIDDDNSANYDVYTFADESQRIIRKVNNTYELENPDYSKEIYDSEGRINKVYDKYDMPIFSYSYNDIGTLRSISYRYSKNINFDYDSSNNLSAIRYSDKVINVNSGTNGLNVIHYNGVTYQLSLSSNNYNAMATATEGTSTITYTTKIGNPTNSLCSLKITDLVKTDDVEEIVDEMTYVFSENIFNESNTAILYSQKYSYVNVADKNGVIVRTQYQDIKPLYSYEIKSNGELLGDNINVINTWDNVEGGGIRGVFNKNVGHSMAHSKPSMQEWSHDMSQYYSSSISGYYILSGWIRSINNTDSSKLRISRGGGTIDMEFNPNVTPFREWKYFAYKFHMNANMLYVFPENSNFVELKDLRITFIPEHISDDSDEIPDVSLSEDVLIYHGGSTYDYVLIENAQFYCDQNCISDKGTIGFEDVLKYKLNKKKNVNINEIYYNKCKNVYLSSSGELKVMYNGAQCSIDNFYLGKRRYKSKKKTIELIKDNNSNSFVYQVLDSNETVVLSKTYNINLDVRLVNRDGIVVSYERMDDLIRSESVYDLYTRTRSYSADANNNPTITDTDEFNKSTVYTLDPVWGNIMKITLPNGQVITDEYDLDGCAKLKRTFATGGRFNSYDYLGGNLSKVQSGDVSYDFIYSKGELSSIKKNGVVIEEHESTDINL